MRPLKPDWRSDMGVEPTQDRITAPQTVLKTAAVTGPRVAPHTYHPTAGAITLAGPAAADCLAARHPG